MRIVVFDVSGVLEAFDYRGVLIHKQEVQANQKLKLPFTQKTFLNSITLFLECVKAWEIWIIEITLKISILTRF